MDTTTLAAKDKLSTSSRERNPRWIRVKTTLRIIAILFATVSLIECLVLLRYSSRLNVPGLPITSSLICMIWNCAVLTLSKLQSPWASKTQRFHIFLEGAVCAIGFAATATQATFVSSGSHASEVLQALTGTIALFSVLHFVIIIRYCVEERRRKKDKRVRQLIQSLFQENQRNIALSTPPHFSPPQSTGTLNREQRSLQAFDRPNITAELPCKHVVAELAAPEPVELPGDHDRVLLRRCESKIMEL